VICFPALYACRKRKEDKMVNWIKSHSRTLLLVAGYVSILAFADIVLGFNGFMAGAACASVLLGGLGYYVATRG
jgi:hypothetical protein